ncbi:hypothetical protein NG99_23245 [Erwinia typographi]|uniref:Peptidase S24/S26A/S26B/S26C domain-containing protein n=1 Tax=Erwinia typographi TaxID=371042 RepID=A0A0A3YLE6_9GAMM|nr:S24 family peptidase [Erwinia typographi]KGT87465.1 hypothetical protein NG99_23245 [Erwinia typographi]
MGFPSPAQDYIEDRISLDRLCILRPSATYFMKAGIAAPQFGIMKDALLVVDRARTPVDGSLVVAGIEGENRLCMLKLHPLPCLMNLETMRPLLRLDTDYMDVEATVIFGVVTFSVNDTSCFEFDERPCI